MQQRKEKRFLPTRKDRLYAQAILTYVVRIESLLKSSIHPSEPAHMILVWFRLISCDSQSI
jgi:hypothetical protein